VFAQGKWARREEIAEGNTSIAVIGREFGQKMIHADNSKVDIVPTWTGDYASFWTRRR